MYFIKRRERVMLHQTANENNSRPTTTDTVNTAGPKKRRKQ
jgi:hypothetical protein